MLVLYILFLAILLICLRVLYVTWHSLAFVHPLPMNKKLLPSRYDFIQPGTLILTKIRTSTFSVNHLSIALSHDRIFECMTPQKQRTKGRNKVRYHFFAFHVADILPKLIKAARGLVIRQPIRPLTNAEMGILTAYQTDAATFDFNYMHQVDLFRHRFFSTDDDYMPQCVDRKTFCTQYISIMLRSIHRLDARHHWNFPAEFSSEHPHDVIARHYAPNAEISS